MPFVLTNLVEHGAGNPIVARLIAQILGLARQTTPKEKHDAIGAKYLDYFGVLMTGSASKALEWVRRGHRAQSHSLPFQSAHRRLSWGSPRDASSLDRG